MSSAMTAADFQQRVSAWMASQDQLSMAAMGLLISGNQIGTQEALDLLAIAFAAGYLQRARDALDEQRMQILASHTEQSAH